MEEELIKIFHKAKYEGNSNLAENTWHAIVKCNTRAIRFKLWSFSFIGIISLAGILPAWKALSNDLAQSGFYEYLSLAFSRDGLILSYWKEITFSIAESMPLMSLIMLLLLIFVLFFSLKYTARQIIKSQLLLSF